MTATVQSTNTSVMTGNSTTHTVDLPATVNSGDFLIIFAATDGTPTTTAPTGWTKIIDNRIHVFVKVADGTEGGTQVTFSSSASEQSAHISFAGDNWGGSLSDIEISTGTTGNSTTPDPDVSPTVTNADNLFVAIFGAARGDVTLTSYPTDYDDNQFFNPNGNGGPGATISVASRDLTAANDNPGVFTIGAGTSWGAGTLVIKPAAAGATTALTGTMLAGGIDEDDITTGGKTIIITLTGDTFVTGTTSEDGIAGGSDSDKTGANKWDALIKGSLDNTDLVLSGGDTVATITMPAFPSYDTDETETITWTIPAASLTTSTSAIIATPTFTIAEAVSGFQAAWARGSNVLIQGGVQ